MVGPPSARLNCMRRTENQLARPSSAREFPGRSVLPLSFRAVTRRDGCFVCLWPDDRVPELPGLAFTAVSRVTPCFP